MSAVAAAGLSDWLIRTLPDTPGAVLAELVGTMADMAILLRLDGTVSDFRAPPEIAQRLAAGDWVGDRLHDRLTRESRPKLDRCLSRIEETSSDVPIAQLNHPVAGEAQDLPVSYTFHRLPSDHGILLLGRDLRPVAEMQQQLVSAQIALEREYESQRDTDTRLRVLMSATSEACIFVDVVTREVIEANPAATVLLGRGSRGVDGIVLDKVLHPQEGTSDLIELLVDAATGQADGNVIAFVGGEGTEVRIAPSSFRMSGAHTLLCRLTPRAAASGALDPTAQRLTDLYSRSTDAMIFVSSDGLVLSANDAFLDLVDVAQEQGVRGRSLSEFLNRGGIDMTVVLDNAARSGTLRMFATKIVKTYGQTSPIEMSVTRLDTGGMSIFGFVIRDVSRADAIRSQKSSDMVDMGSVIGLLGKQSLKEIVADTTDVIERMCIEAAVELTSNNRLAAADMLGLSRQSLYVKLRKYDLLKRDVI